MTLIAGALATPIRSMAQLPSKSLLGVAPAKLAGIKWTQFDPVHPSMAFGTIVGFAEPLDGCGPYWIRVADMLGGKYNFNDRWEMYGYYTPFGTTHDKVIILCSDSRGDTVSLEVNIAKTDGSHSVLMLNSRNPMHNATTNSFYNGPWIWAQAGGGRHGGADAVKVTGADGRPQSAWTQQDGPVRYKSPSPPPIGEYPLRFTATDANGADPVDATRVFSVIAPTPITFIEFEQYTISTSVRPGGALGVLRATTPNNKPIFSVSGIEGLSVNPATREVIATKGLASAGDLVFMTTVKDATSAFSMPQKLTVRQGNTLPPEKMTMSDMNSKLTNGPRAQHIGRIRIDGRFAKRPAFSIVAQTRHNPVAVTAANPARIKIDPMSGVLSATSKLSAGSDTITVQATDGVTVCLQSFTIPVADATKTYYYVGPRNPATIGGIVPVNTIWLGKSMDEARRLCMSEHNDHKHIFWEADPSNPDSYANQTGADIQDYSLRFAWIGPGTLELLLGSDRAEPKTHLGGHSRNDTPGGSDMRGKGALVLGDGDWTLIAPVIGYTHGADLTHGLEAVRKDGETVGDVTIVGGRLTSSDNGFETGACHGMITLDRVELDSCGTSHVSSGACHNAYVGAVWKLVLKNIVSRGATLGHEIKSRAMITEITGGRFYDGLSGSSSCNLDLSNGGLVTIDGILSEKGAQAMNPFSIQYGAEGLIYEENAFIMRNSTVSILAVGGSHYGAHSGIFLFTKNRGPSDAPMHIELTNNRFFSGPNSVATGFWRVDDASVPVNESGTVVLKAAPLLGNARPYFSGPLPPLPPLYYHGLWGADYYRDFDGAMQIADRDEIVVSKSAKAGTVIATLYARNQTMAKQLNQFTAGTTVELVRDSVNYPLALPDPWAPDGLYDVNSRLDGGADLVIRGAISGRGPLDVVQVQFTAPGGGAVSKSRYPIKLYV